ncbi:MAG: choice-of-anchor J domain-containing protein [Bacteroidota bacterium]
MKNYILILFASCFTSLIAAQVTILEENFDANGIPSSWKIVDNDNHTPAEDVSEYTAAWIIKGDPMNAGNNVASSTSYFDPVDRADRWLITPQFTLGSSGNYISWKGLSADPSFPDSYKVMISTTTNDISAFEDTLFIVNNESPEWTTHLRNLEQYANQSIYLAFVNTTFDGFKLYLDSVNIREQDPLSTPGEEDLALSLYPNPVQDELTVETEKDMRDVVIYSALGRRVANKNEINQRTVTIELRKLPKGVYNVEIQLMNGSVVRRKVVKR